MIETINIYLPILIAAVLAFFFSRRETISSKVRENKIEAIKDYIKAFQALRLAMRSYYYQYEHGEHTEAKFKIEEDAVREAIIEHDLQILILELFIKQDDQKFVKDISDRFEVARLAIAAMVRMGKSELSYWSEEKVRKIDSDYEAVKDILERELPEKIKVFGKQFRIDFGVDPHPNYKILKDIGRYILFFIIALAFTIFIRLITLTL